MIRNWPWLPQWLPVWLPSEKPVFEGRAGVFDHQIQRPSRDWPSYLQIWSVGATSGGGGESGKRENGSNWRGGGGVVVVVEREGEGG